MLDKLQLINSLKEDHKILKEELLLIINNYNFSNFDEVISLLSRFRQDFREHLNLEEKSFYPNYIKESERQNLNTTGIKEFIAEMVSIDQKVINFLDKYSDKNKLNSDFNSFKADFYAIQRTITLRIDIEEHDHYDIYSAMK